jgi:bacillithiol system protein YtxJ
MELRYFQTIDSFEKANALWQVGQGRPQLLFKHSFRCGISVGALFALGPFLEELKKHTDLFLIDVVAARAISMNIAEQFNVIHQSPQVILWQNQKVIFHTSHAAIQGQIILRKLSVGHSPLE